MPKPYMGRNRRWKDRRVIKERRQIIRFEINNEPRRQTQDRRGGGAWETMFLNR